MVEENESGGDDKAPTKKIVRLNYEIAVFEELRRHLRCKSIWIRNSYRYRNPDDDLPKDFDENEDDYFNLLGLPKDANELIKKLKQLMDQHLTELNDTILSNDKLNIVNKNGGQFKLSPYQAQDEPENLIKLQRKIIERWSSINLLDVLKETEIRLNFSTCFNTLATRTTLTPDVLRKRLLLCLYALGSNAGLKRISTGNQDATYNDLKYVKRTFITAENIRAVGQQTIE